MEQLGLCNTYLTTVSVCHVCTCGLHRVHVVDIYTYAQIYTYSWENMVLSIERKQQKKKKSPQWFPWHMWWHCMCLCSTYDWSSSGEGTPDQGAQGPWPQILRSRRGTDRHMQVKLRPQGGSWGARQSSGGRGFQAVEMTHTHSGPEPGRNFSPSEKLCIFKYMFWNILIPLEMYLFIHTHAYIL